MQELILRCKRIKLAIFDVDGTLTDGALVESDSGQQTKAFDTQDGHGMKMLQRSGVELAIITARRSQLVDSRAQTLGVRHVQQGVANKLAAYQALLVTLRLNDADCLYMGDEVLDLPVLRRCGVSAAPAQAPLSVREAVHYVTRRHAGRGAAREVCELLLRSQHKLHQALAQS